MLGSLEASKEEGELGAQLHHLLAGGLGDFGELLPFLSLSFGPGKWGCI